MNTKIKYGLVTSIVWLFFQALLFIVGYNYRKTPLIDNYIDVIGLTLFMIITTLVWFWIGYRLRTKYIEELSYYKKEYTGIENKRFEKEFLSYFIFKRARMMGLLFLVAIPWYMLSPLRETSYDRKDYTILFIFFCLTVISFTIHFKGRNKYKDS